MTIQFGADAANADTDDLTAAQIADLAANFPGQPADTSSDQWQAWAVTALNQRRLIGLDNDWPSSVDNGEDDDALG